MFSFYCDLSVDKIEYILILGHCTIIVEYLDAICIKQCKHVYLITRSLHLYSKELVS